MAFVNLTTLFASGGAAGTGPWLRVDGLGLALLATVAIVGVTVLAYARRNLAGAPRAGWFFAGATGVLAGTVTVALAGRLSVLVAGWLVTSASVVVVLAGRGDATARRTARQAAGSLAVGDVALVAAAAATWWAVGDADLSHLGAVAAELSSSDAAPLGIGVDVLVPVLLGVAALARAAQVPLHRWLPGTVNAPTPASALLHAGVVNAGGFLLVRTGPVFASTAVAPSLVVGVSIATILVAGGSALLRRDTKGQLATSTSAQMGFMLVAAAVGAPIAAMSHLVGHALYKSSRFLGAGDAIRLSVADRRWSPSVDRPLPVPARVALAAVAPAVGLAVGWLLVGDQVLKGADGWVLATALTVTTARACWVWTSRSAGSTVRSAATGSAVLGSLVVAYLLVATGLELAIVDSIDRAGSGYVSAPLALALLAGLAAPGLGALDSARFGPRIRGALAPGGGIGRATGRAPAARRAPLTDTARLNQYQGAS